MSDIEQELYKYVRQVPDVIAALGTGAPENTRLFPDVAPQSAVYPRASYQRISDSGVVYMGGGSDLSHALFQFDVFARSPADRKAASNAIRKALHGAQGFDAGEVAVRSVKLNGEVDTADYIDDGTDVPVYRTRMDFMIWYKRTAPAFTL